MKNFVITIGREYGSGAGQIARRLAEKLSIKVYDKEMISLAAKESGLAESVVKETEQKKTNSFLYSLYMTSQVLPASDRVFIAQTQIIKKLAKEESCIIIGRCADNILKDEENCLKVFVHAPMEAKKKRIIDEYGLGIDKPEEYIRKVDKQRAAYYKYFTEQTWGCAQNYDVCINTDIGIDEAVEIICRIAKAKFGI